MNRLVRTLMCVLFSCSVFAQEQYTSQSEKTNIARQAYYSQYGRWTLGANVGVSALWGDFSSFAHDNTYVAPLGSFQVIYQETPTLGFSLEAFVGKNRLGAIENNANEYLNFYGYRSAVGADPYTSEVFLQYKDLYSDVMLVQGRLGVDIHLNNLFSGNKADTMRKYIVVFSPSYYLQYYRPVVYRKNDGKRYTNRDLFYQNSNGVGAELALRMRLSRVFDLQLKTGGVYGFNKKFDGVAGNSDNNLLAYFQAGVLFKLNGETKRENLIRAATLPYVPEYTPIIEEKIIRDTIYIEKIVERIKEVSVSDKEGVSGSKSIKNNASGDGSIEESGYVTQSVSIPALFFRRGYAVIDEAKYQHNLQEMIRVLNEYSQLQIRIEGWCDKTGTDYVNAKLSQRRAEVLRQYLINKGIDASRITDVTGKGVDYQNGYTQQARRAVVFFIED
ncbi:OmpA family protein [Capnocytophaga canimorsus]|uniref:OmpA family protein n=1 Tax=Capnocytophaga canimorsus TaxID=28188 RepID=UPI0037D658F2